MDYGFGELQNGEIFRSECGLSGEQVVVEKYEDSTITHRFRIKGTIRTNRKQSWYSISNHTTVVDKSAGLQQQLNEQSDALTELAEIIGEMG